MRLNNRYFQGFRGDEEKIDYLKYGLFNERGYNIDACRKDEYNPDKVMKSNGCHEKQRKA